jgi:hypothetical protein
MKQQRFTDVVLWVALLVTFAPGLRAVAAPAHADMTQAATDFLAALSAEEKSRSAFPLESPDRIKWHFLPPEMFPRGGVVLRDLDAEQKGRARVLLQAGLSQSGYLAATAIMELEHVIRALEQGQRFARDAEEYYVSIFGTPDPRGNWAWRFEGHHLSLHFTVVAGQITVSTPTFLGTNPAELREGPQKGLRPLGPQEDSARALMLALTESQRTRALISETVPADIITGNAFPIDPLASAGIEAAALSSDQRALLKVLIESYTSLMSDEIAAQRWARIHEAGFEHVAFAWAGSTEPGKPHYYRVQGPTFLIEYDNTQNNANHAHSVWRDFKGDFGQDLLREHYHMDAGHMKDFATRYTAAWCSQDPASVATFFADQGSFKINDGAPSVGRSAITEAARGFMKDFPDMIVEMGGLDREGDRYIYRWTLSGTNTGFGGTGNKVRISGYQEWAIGADGLIATSLGHFDAADYQRQLGKADGRYSGRTMARQP